MANNKGLPGGSSAFAQAMADINSTPVVEITESDDVDIGPKKGHKHSHHEEGKLVHGLHHCYKVEGGNCLTSFRCNHDHHRISNGHLEDITHIAGTSPTPRRRLSIAASGPSLLAPDDGYFRGRTNSESRRASVAVGQQRRNSLVRNDSNENCARRASMNVSPKSQRRGSNVALHAGEMHYVYDQYLSK